MDCLFVKFLKFKYFYKLNVWGGIFYRGLIDICVFIGIMDFEIYLKIFEDNFFLFIFVKFLDGFRFY